MWWKHCSFLAAGSRVSEERQWYFPLKNTDVRRASPTCTRLFWCSEHLIWLLLPWGREWENTDVFSKFDPQFGFLSKPWDFSYLNFTFSFTCAALANRGSSSRAGAARLEQESTGAFPVLQDCFGCSVSLRGWPYPTGAAIKAGRQQCPARGAGAKQGQLPKWLATTVGDMGRLTVGYGISVLHLSVFPHSFSF